MTFGHQPAALAAERAASPGLAFQIRSDSNSKFRKFDFIELKCPNFQVLFLNFHISTAEEPAKKLADEGRELGPDLGGRLRAPVLVALPQRLALAAGPALMISEVSNSSPGFRPFILRPNILGLFDSYSTLDARRESEKLERT